MFNIIRRDPMREMRLMRNIVDRFFDDSFFSQDWEGIPGFSESLPLDVEETDDEFMVSASLPGIHPDDLDITYSGSTLTIKGEVKQENEEKEEKRNYYLRERHYGSFSRSITLPSTVKADKIEASYEAGVLKLRLPKAEEAKPKRIPIKASLPKMIEGKVREVANKK